MNDEKKDHIVFTSTKIGRNTIKRRCHEMSKRIRSR